MNIIKPGDTVILTLDLTVPTEKAEQLTRELAALMPDVKLILMYGAMIQGVYRPADQVEPQEG